MWLGLSLALFVWAGLVKFGHGESILGLWATIVPEGISDTIRGQLHWADMFLSLTLISFWTIVFLAGSLLIAWAITAIIAVPFALARKNSDVEKRETGS